MSRRRWQILAKLGLVLMSTFLAGLGFELYLRHVVKYYPKVLIPHYLYDNHPQAWWKLRARYTTTQWTPDGDVTYAINSQGIRSPVEYQKLGEDRPVQRIFVLGDSLTFGWATNEENAFPRLLESRLKQKGYAVEVVNLGVPGYGTLQEYYRLIDAIDVLGRPDIVLLMFCPNDPVDSMTGKKEIVAGVRIDSHRRFKPLLALVARIYQASRLVAFLVDTKFYEGQNPRANLEKEIRTAEVPVETRDDFNAAAKYLELIMDVVEKNGAEFLVAETSSSEYTRPLAALIRARTGMGIFNMPEGMARRNPEQKPTKLAFDGHWNPFGHQLVAEELEERLLKRGWLRTQPVQVTRSMQGH